MSRKVDSPQPLGKDIVFSASDDILRCVQFRLKVKKLMLASSSIDWSEVIQQRGAGEQTYQMVAILQGANCRDEQHEVGGGATSAHCDNFWLPTWATASGRMV